MNTPPSQIRKREILVDDMPPPLPVRIKRIRPLEPNKPARKRRLNFVGFTKLNLTIF